MFKSRISHLFEFRVRYIYKILVIDGNNNKTIHADYAEPKDAELNEDTNTIYVSNSNSDSVSIIKGKLITPSQMLNFKLLLKVPEE